MAAQKLPTGSLPEEPITARKSTPAPPGNGMFQRSPMMVPDLATDIRTTILVQSPRGGRCILWAVVFFIALAVFWAAISEIEEVTRGMGKVIPTSQIQVVQNLEGGILNEVLVKVGQIVEKDQLLLRIDDTRFSAPYQESRANYLALKAKIARLEAETHLAPFVIPEEITKEKPEIGQRELELYQSRQEELTATLAILQEKANQRKQEISELKSKLDKLTRTAGLLGRELKLTKPLVAQGAVSEVEVLRLERQVSEMQGDIEATRLSIPTAESRLKEAQRELAEERLQFANKAKEELNEAHATFDGLSANTTALADRVRRTSVRSPVHGTVNRILVNTLGGVIQPGMDLIEIVPLEDTLLVEAKIKPADIAFLRPQQQAMVKFTAYDFTIYGGLEAELEHIGADSITDEQGNEFYLVRVRTRKNYLGQDSNPLPIIPGMVASVDILTGRKTILSKLLKPMLRAKDMALRER